MLIQSKEYRVLRYGARTGLLDPGSIKECATEAEAAKIAEAWTKGRAGNWAEIYRRAGTKVGTTARDPKGEGTPPWAVLWVKDQGKDYEVLDFYSTIQEACWGFFDLVLRSKSHYTVAPTEAWEAWRELHPEEV